jgi:hypothetical protein
LLAKGSQISNEAKYNDITAMAGSINSALRAFLSLNTTDQFDSLSRASGIRITLNPDVLPSMERQYACAR